MTNLHITQDLMFTVFVIVKNEAIQKTRQNAGLLHSVRKDDVA
jgi:hypothetical protein